MKILFFEPFFGGSHKDFATGFAKASGHEVNLVTLPARFWKWRMRGAALYLLNQVKDLADYDLIFTTDMVDVTDLKGLAGPRMPPVALYFHENQLSYPLGPGEKRDYHLGFTNIVSAHAADAVFFNSWFHLNDFLEAARDLIGQMPDFRPGWILDGIEEKARVLYPGCRFSGKDQVPDLRPPGPPIIVWNHRWEYDKNPEGFFSVMRQLKGAGVCFSLAVLGERFRAVPPVFDQAKEEFRDEICAWGYVRSRKAYEAWLKKGQVVVSTAIQENFGISVIEAVRHGCFPLLPRRLSYPEIVPEHSHGTVLYESPKDLFTKLKALLADVPGDRDAQAKLCVHAGQYAWETIVKQYDKALNNLII